jgi:hypothetical protein
LGILSRRQLNVRIHDRGESKVTVAAKETKVLDVPNPMLNVADLERGYWQVVFSTPINDSRLTLDLWLDGQDAAWSSSRNMEAERVTQHEDPTFKGICWGGAMQGIRFGTRMKSDPDDSLLWDARRKGRLRVTWPESDTVTLLPEYYLWNTTSSDVEVSMLHHATDDWDHKIRRNDGTDVSVRFEIGGPKFEERHRIAAGAVISLGSSSIKMLRDFHNGGDFKMPQNEFGYWTFLNLHRIDQPHLNLHLKSGLQELIDGQSGELNRRQ